MEQRIETDSLGEVRVPADAYYGAQTARSLENFPIGHDTFPRPFLRALGRVKAACAEANSGLGALDSGLAALIVRAAREVAGGSLDEQFPLVVWQTGSATHTNMNANEVIANRANEVAGSPLGGYSPIHPNDHVNRSQSSNDVIPTAMHVSAAVEITESLLPALEELRDALREKATRYKDTVKLGRTHLMDAVPLTLGQELSGYVHQMDAAHRRLEQSLDGLYELAIGGTAVGTGLNAPPGFAEAAAERLAASTGLPFRPAANRFEAQGAHDAVVFASGALRNLAVALFKIANDIRLLASGPRAGFGELTLPANEPGSSIMPGKINPTQAEALTMVCAQVIGNDAAVVLGGMSGHLEMNVFKPLLIRNVLHSIELLGDAMRSFARRCIAGMEVSGQTVSDYVERSLMLVTALSPRLGYDRAAEVARRAFEQNVTLREAAASLGYLTEKEFDKIILPEGMVGDHGRLE
jgi:fumarate hydratase class II